MSRTKGDARPQKRIATCSVVGWYLNPWLPKDAHPLEWLGSGASQRALVMKVVLVPVLAKLAGREHHDGGNYLAKDIRRLMKGARPPQPEGEVLARHNNSGSAP